MTSDPMTVAVTGAGGFLGRHVVAAARAQGLSVRALIRSTPPESWSSDPGIMPIVCDLSQSAADDKLAAAFGGVGSVIHAAAGFGGDAAHQRDTLAATRAVLAALAPGAQLMLVSSFSVYCAAAVPEDATLDELTPTEADATRRDPYTRAKLAQERLAVAAAQAKGLELRIARPGAIYGPKRVWSARLGWRKGSRVLTLGGRATVPAIHVESCASALVKLALAERSGWPSDLPASPGGGHISWLNLLDADPPNQADWIEALGLRAIPIPHRACLKAAALLDLAADCWPWLDRRLPSGLREGTLAARFKPMRFSRARLEDRLGGDTAGQGGAFVQRLKQARSSP